MARFEERIATLILWSGGFAASSSPEEAPGIVRAVEETTIPVLMRGKGARCAAHRRYSKSR